MKLRMWSYDLAREQAPSLDHLYRLAHASLDAGYNALGLYLEHRFAYRATPWSHGKHCLTPDMVRSLRSEFPSLRLIPMINLLGHFEGFLYTEEGKQYREELFSGLQACPAHPGFVRLCEQLIDETIELFDDEIIHIGGDETQQLGVSPVSQARIAELQQAHPGETDAKALLYGSHFGPLAQRVVDRGRRPAVWGDMYAEHPSALDWMPQETLIFDWQYFTGVRDTAKLFTDKGFEVVGCPAIQTYNATWCHLGPTEKNVREVATDVVEDDLYGVCVTTWECALMGAYDTILPAIEGCGAILNGSSATLLENYEKAGCGRWAQLMSEDIATLGGSFTPGRIRSSLKTRLLLMGNPFLLWMHHHEEYCGEIGHKAVELANQALFAAPSEAEKGPALLLRSGVEFVQIAEAARQHYAAGEPSAAIGKLAHARSIFDDLAKVARRTHERIGGSLADIERCRVAREHVETVMKRIKCYGNRELGYLPSFEHITNHKFMPHDQAAWWLINKWANQ